ncbi:MAG TPA: hypothetical protein VFO16_01585 [Pseudonocardiaceae bacterium]|nr:hypothetical protein [Pseudonocardiaceae bacterium]
MGHEEARKRQLVQAAAVGATDRLTERFGRPIRVGGTYTLDLPLPPTYVVESIRPVLDPGAPPGLCRVVLRSEQTIITEPQRRVDFLTLVGYAEPEQPPQQPPDRRRDGEEQQPLAQPPDHPEQEPQP